MPMQPLAEVFGFPIDNLTPEAKRHREKRLCPFNNRVPNCTKDRARDPLGVCSVYHRTNVAITCPVRFRQHWIIADDAADFFFPPQSLWTSLTEVRLNDKHGRSAGNIDAVLVAYDDDRQIVDFGALEVQAVYISGNVRQPFQHYMEDPQNRHEMDWTGQRNYPRPDYLSSSRKRLAPQLLHKGGILNTWQKKMAVAVDRSFYATLPPLPAKNPEEADIVWLVYDLVLDLERNRYDLVRCRSVYTSFAAALRTLTEAEAGPVEDFIQELQGRIDEKLEIAYPPEAPTLRDILEHSAE